MNASTNFSTNATDTLAAVADTGAQPPSLPPCGVFFPEKCGGDDDVTVPMLDNESRFLVVVIFSLAFIAFALCMVTCMLTFLVHKLSHIWVGSLGRPAAAIAAAEAEANDARKGLLQETKSSLRESSSSSSSSTPSDKVEGKKKKKTSFAEDTSCASLADVDEEDL